MINKGKVISVKKLNNFNFFSKNKYLLVLSFLYLFGIITSIILYSNNISFLNFEYFFNLLYISRGNISFIKMFFKSLLSFISVLTLIFISGTSITGICLIPAIVFFLGYFMGGITGFLYTSYSLKGIAFNALIILLPSFFFILVVFVGSKIALEYSGSLSNIALKRSMVNNKTSFKQISIIFGILLIVLVFTSLLDAGLSAIFLKIFNL